MRPQLRVESLATSHEGRVRTNNEDSFCERPEVALWAVADGMGGHENGEWASAAIADALRAVALPEAFEPACQAIADSLHAANGRIWAEASARDIQMGSTVVALHLNGPNFAIFWVGDSRAYLLREGTLHQISRDHTQVQEMVDRGLLDIESARDHPMSHVLARAVGVQPDVAVDVIADEVAPGDVFLLCSDGLTGQVQDGEIAELLALPNHRSALDQLVALTLERGAPDNVTIIIVAVNETTMLSIGTPMGNVEP